MGLTVTAVLVVCGSFWHYARIGRHGLAGKILKIEFLCSFLSRVGAYAQKNLTIFGTRSKNSFAQGPVLMLRTFAFGPFVTRNFFLALCESGFSEIRCVSNPALENSMI
jgi:hypothetical protein